MLSRLSYLLCAICLLYTSFIFYPRWKTAGGNATISWDAAGYYWYLPSAIIYHDLKGQHFKDSIVSKYRTADNFQPGPRLPNGNYVFKYSSGMAVMSLPAFLVANSLAKPLGYPQDGFSPPYQLAIQLGGVLLALLGLWYFRKLLLRFYNDTVVAITLFLLVIGSNYLDFAAIDVGMTHSNLFTVYVFLLLATYNFYNTYKVRYAIAIGLLVGIATLTRPTDIIACIIPVLWGMESISLPAIRQRFALLKVHFSKLLIAAVCAVAVIFIQLAYWKYSSGHWLFYSYEDQGFSFLKPHVMAYTFSWESGWLLYTPILLLAFIGVIPFLKYGRNKVAILLFFLIDYYLVCAWDVTWYGGRAMVQGYPILFFCIAALLQWAFEHKVWLWVLVPVIGVFTYFNIWVTYQEHKGGLYIPAPSDFVTNAYFWRTAGRWSVPPDYVRLRDSKDLFEGVPHNMQLVYHNEFEQDSACFSVPPIDGKGSLFMDDNHKESPHYLLPVRYSNTASWLRAQATIKCVNKEWEKWRMTQFVVQFSKAGKSVKGGLIRMQRYVEEDKPGEVYIDVKLPNHSFDKAEVFFINGYSDKKVIIDDLKVWSFN
ncbi:MAG: hypothetical protein H0X33_04150 [Taibaiella sp.]|nr:hypothetical protein [Taibaiella sp.]